MEKIINVVRHNRWSGPLALAVVITVLHFSFDAHLMFWHDLLRRAYYLPIVWSVYLFAFRGGVIMSSAVAAIFAIHLLTGWRHHLGGQVDQIYDIVGYLAVGFGVGFIVNRARQAAFALAEREYEVSLRGVISAAVHEIKKPKTEIDGLANELTKNTVLGTWEHSVGQRVLAASRRLAELRQDLAGIAKIYSSRSVITKPFDWATRFANDEHLGARFGLITARIDAGRPPPAIWPIPSSVLDEVTRCLVEDVAATTGPTAFAELLVAAENGHLVIEYRRLFAGVQLTEPSPLASGSSSTSRVRQKLLELMWSRFNGGVQRLDDPGRSGFRLTLYCPKVRLPRPAGLRPKTAA